MESPQEVPYDVWEQIFLRVPAETMIGLKSVCKRWCELINNNHFQITHLNHRRSSRSQVITKVPLRPQMLLLSWDLVGGDIIPSKLRCRPLGFEKLLPAGPNNEDDRAAVLDCCDGLFLVLMSEHLFLCNPLTNSYLAIPDHDDPTNKDHWKVVYDPSTQGYVIFSLEYISPKIQVVSSLRIDDLKDVHGRNNWQQIWSSENLALETEPFDNVSFLASTSSNGMAHWLFSFTREYDPSIGNTWILTINAATEKSLVKNCSATPIMGKFFKSNRKFYCMKESSISRELALELWVVDPTVDNNSKWSKHPAIIKMDPKIMRNRAMRVCKYWGILKHGNRLIIGFSCWKDVIIYDISLKKWQLVNIVNEGFIPRHNLGLSSDPREFMSIHYSLLKWN